MVLKSLVSSPIVNKVKISKAVQILWDTTAFQIEILRGDNRTSTIILIRLSINFILQTLYIIEILKLNN